MSTERNGRALADVDEYVAALGDRVDRFADVVATHAPRLSRLVRRSPVVRSIVTAWLGRRYSLVVAEWGTPGRALPIWVALITGRRRLVYLNFHRTLPNHGSSIRARLGFKLLHRPALRIAARCIQTLSLADEARYRDGYGFDEDRVVFVPYAWRIRRDTATGRSRPGGRRVLASGYAHTDWATFFAAARGAGWEATAVCGLADLQTLHALNDCGLADVRCDIFHDEHTALLRGADVYVVPLYEDRISAGHCRLRDANEYGVPAVAAAIDTLREYLADGVTGLLYTPGDPCSLRAAVDRLLDNPSLADSISAAAVERSSAWDHQDHYRAQRTLVERLLGVPGADERPLEPAAVTALRKTGTADRVG